MSMRLLPYATNPIPRWTAVSAPIALLAMQVAGCSAPSQVHRAPAPGPAASTVTRTPSNVVISVVGTSDLHGRIDRLPWLAGYLSNLRSARRAQGGGLVLVDAGDMFQGTLESNLGEGEVVIRAYNAMGYHAATVGNHEFDYGPAGSKSTPTDPGDDPRGALAERARQAAFPLLASNIVLTGTDRPLTLPRGGPGTIVEVAGVRVGIVGASTIDTLRTTAGPNVRDLAMAPLAATIEREAGRLRSEQGASVVIALVHAGGACKELGNPRDLSSCDDGELMQVARSLPRGVVDAMVGGHTHQAIAHDIAGIAVVQSWAQGRGFGRVDLTVEPGTGRVVSREIHPPRELCANGRDPDASCDAGTYEAAPVSPDSGIAALVQAAMARADGERRRPLGVAVETPIVRQHRAESALGNLLADLMRASRPGTDVAVMNGGGIRADLAPGPLRYGALYAVFPFDNRFARVRLKASVLARMLASNASEGGGFLSVSGVRAIMRCADGQLRVELRRDDDRLIRDEETLVVLASDFLATGGDGAFAAAGVEASAFEIEDDPPIREALAETLARRGGTLRAQELMPAGKPRVVLPGERPVRCDSR